MSLKPSGLLFFIFYVIYIIFLYGSTKKKKKKLLEVLRFKGKLNQNCNYSTKIIQQTVDIRK